MKNYNFCLIACACLFSLFTYAQDDNDDVHTVTLSVPEVALLDLEASAGTGITLGPAAPTEAGLPVDFSAATDNTIWMNYSSIVGTVVDPSRTVSVQITTGTVPAGTELTVVAAADAGNGDGTMGTPSAALTLSGTAQDIITGVGSAYTGDGVNNGHNLTYTLSLLAAGGSYATLDFTTGTALSVTYTLSDI